MSKFPGSSTAKRNAPFVSHMDGRQVTQRGLPTDREPGKALEKQDGSPSKRKAGLLRPFHYSDMITDCLLELSYRTGFS
jgi:hypothetical protein